MRRVCGELAVRRRRQLPDGDDGVRPLRRGVHAVVAGHALPGPAHQSHGDARVVLPLRRRRARLRGRLSRCERRRAGYAPRARNAAERWRRRLRGARAALRAPAARPARRGRSRGGGQRLGVQARGVPSMRQSTRQRPYPHRPRSASSSRFAAISTPPSRARRPPSRRSEAGRPRARSTTA